MGFTKEFINKIKALCAAGYTHAHIAEMYGLKESTVRAIVDHD